HESTPGWVGLCGCRTAAPIGFVPAFRRGNRDPAQPGHRRKLTPRGRVPCPELPGQSSGSSEMNESYAQQVIIGWGGGTGVRYESTSETHSPFVRALRTERPVRICILISKKQD